MTTEAQLVTWLKSSTAVRCVLLEVVARIGGVETTRYISDKGYVTKAADTPSNTVYQPLLSGGVEFTESISLDGSVSVSYGDIEIDNINGENDTWVNNVWVNRPINVFIGDVTWNRSDFYQIFSGNIADIAPQGRNKVKLSLRDKMQRLNTPVSEVKLGGSTPNSDKLKPLLFGEGHNLTPIITDGAIAEEYQIHNGPIERIIEVRDNGIPIANDVIGWAAVTIYLATGKFKLNQAAVGTITCSAQGDKPTFYVNNISELVQRLVKDFGNSALKLTSGDLDAANFSAFASAHTQPVGIYLTEKTNLLEACNALASSVGARLVMSRAGLLKLVKIDLPRIDVGTTVTESDMTVKSLSIKDMPPVVAGVKLGYCKNYTVQTTLAAGVPANHSELFGQEWITSSKTAPSVATNYKLFTDVDQQDTQLLTTANADSEAQRRLNMFSVQRYIMSYEGCAHLMPESLGNTQTLRHPRFNLSAGVAGQIISITTRWLKGRVDIDVLI